MGDRANVAIRLDDDTRVYLYTHWSGSSLVDDVHTALARRERWSDGSYLARVLFCGMCTDYESALSYGISTRIGDNTAGWPIIVVDPETQMIWLEDADYYKGPGTAPPAGGDRAERCWGPHTFDELVTSGLLLQSMKLTMYGYGAVTA